MTSEAPGRTAAGSPQPSGLPGLLSAPAPCRQHILVTRGLGYLGSHTCLALLEAGYDVTVLDDLSNSRPECLQRLRLLAAGRSDRFAFVQGDVRDAALLRTLLAGRTGQAGGDEQSAAASLSAACRRPVDAVVHFAALKSVGESLEHPLDYYSVNLAGTLELLQAMMAAGCKKLVFSSSACVYGETDSAPVQESAPLRPLSPYGRSKVLAESMLQQAAAASPDRLSCLALRYFNPAGAHPSGLLGEHPQRPTNLVPRLTDAALGRGPPLQVFGSDYATRDSTAVRDFIHVMDLAEGHVAALRLLLGGPRLPGFRAYNLGTGAGSTVLEVVAAFEAASGRSVPLQMCGRRAGDAAVAVASPQLAEAELGWKARRSLQDMCANHWRWAAFNPRGFLSKVPAAEQERDSGAVATAAEE